MEKDFTTESDVDVTKEDLESSLSTSNEDFGLPSETAAAAAPQEPQETAVTDTPVDEPIAESTDDAPGDTPAAEPGDELLTKVGRMEHDMARLMDVIVSAAAAQQAAPAQEPEKPVDVSLDDLTDDEIIDAMGDPRQMKALLAKAIKRGIEIQQQMTVDRLGKVLPGTVESVVAQREKARVAQDRVGAFFRDYPELKADMKRVDEICGEVMSEHPDKAQDWKWVTEETAKRSFARLNIRRSARTQAPPAGARTPAARQPGGSGINSRLKELQAMDNV